MTVNQRAMALMVAFGALWASVEVVAAPLLHHHSPYQVVWMRYAVHLLLLLAICSWRDPSVLWRTGRPTYQLARSMLMLGMPASWAIAMNAGVPGDTQMGLFWLSPLFVLLLAGWMLGERIGARTWVVAGVACAGSLLVHPLHGVAHVWLLVLPLAMALCLALYVVMTRALRTETTRANLFYTALGVFAALTPAMPFVWTAPSVGELGVMVVVGGLGLLTLLALDRCAGLAPLAVSAPLLYAQLLVTVAVQLLPTHGAFHVPWRLLVGALLIAAALIYFWSADAQPARSPAASAAHRF